MDANHPVIEGLDGTREFLVNGYDGHLYAESRLDKPFPTAASIARVREAYRHRPESSWDFYGYGRAANNEAASHLCRGDLQAALECVQASEVGFLEFLDAENGYPRPLIYDAIAAVRYNATLIFVRAASFTDTTHQVNAMAEATGAALTHADELSAPGERNREIVREALTNLMSQWPSP